MNSSSDLTRRTERYCAHLEDRFGPGVPAEIVEAFEVAYELGWQRPDQTEALMTGLRAGTHDKQRARCGDVS